MHSGRVVREFHRDGLRSRKKWDGIVAGGGCLRRDQEVCSRAARVGSEVKFSGVAGRKSENAVPWCSGDWLERTRMRPLCRELISDVIQRPRPLPESPFVVKKASKMRGRISVGMPQPLSAMVTRMPGVPVCQSVAGRQARMRQAGGSGECELSGF